VTGLLDAVAVGSGNRLEPAYLVPHGPYATSGATAAEVYARLRRHSAEIERVILLGPSHAEPTLGYVASASAAWSTPLGSTPVDEATLRMLIADGHIKCDDELHVAEESLEVQLPFLQVAAPHAMILPILVGVTPAEDIVVTLSALSDLDGTVVIVTTDLGDGSSAGRTLLSILEMAPQRIGVRDACGVHALRGVLGWANHRGLTAELLSRSGDDVACAFYQPS
jgi:hypothetical protein